MGFLWAGIMMMIETPTHPEDVRGVAKLGIVLIIIGLVIAALTLVMAFGNS